MKGLFDGGRTSALAAAAMCVAMAGAAPAASPDDYLYRPETVASTAAVTVQNFENRVQYTTAGGFVRTVRIAVRVATGTPQHPMPVVIVAHGGGEQPNTRNPATTLPQWGETLARAGYLAINVLHGTNTGADRASLCDAIGYPVPSDPADIAQTLEEIAAAFSYAVANGGGVDVEAILQNHPELLAEFEEILADDGGETPVVAQVVSALLTKLRACESINALGLQDRPQDIAAVVNALHDGVLPELAGWVDLTKIAVLGHSNGTSSVLNAVGLQRALPNGVKIEVPLPDGDPRRPVAAVALSPMGVDTYGLFDSTAWAPTVTDSKEHSWMGLTSIPVLTLTGDGDNHCKTRFVCADSDSPGKRRIPFERMPAGDKYLMYVGDIAGEEIVSSHEMFGDLDKPGICRAAALATQCADTVKWIKSTVLAFLDAYVTDEHKARSWLRSRRLSKASGGIATIERK